MLMLMNHLFARPYGCCTGSYTLYVQTITINSAQTDFDIEISHCSFSVMRQLISSILVSNERRWIELCNNENYIFITNSILVENNCSFGFPFYWDALYNRPQNPKCPRLHFSFDNPDTTIPRRNKAIPLGPTELVITRVHCTWIYILDQPISMRVLFPSYLYNTDKRHFIFQKKKTKPVY